MNTGETNRLTDTALIGVLDETAAWALRAKTGEAVAWAASLRMALAMASSGGHEAIALTQEPNDHVIVFQDQIDRLIEARD